VAISRRKASLLLASWTMSMSRGSVMVPPRSGGWCR
jgi:hypothetical protein